MIGISMTRAARLGNQLFQYALVRSVAEKNGYDFYINPEVWHGGNLIKCPLGSKNGEFKYSFLDLDGQKFNPEVFNVRDFTNFGGYFQCEKYFEREKVKEWFKLEYSKEVIDFLSVYPVSEYCYINVRGTDQHIPHLTLPNTYYNKAKEIIMGFNNRLKFVVITDDISLGKEYFPDYPVYSNERDVDFCLLNAARFVIGSISTFVWWSTYLNDYNIVIMPKRFYHYNIPSMGWGPSNIETHKFIWI